MPAPGPPRSWSRNCRRCAAPVSATRGSLKIVPGPAHQIDEDVLERWLRKLPFEVLALPITGDRRFQLVGIAAGHMQAGAEWSHHVDARLGVEFFSKRVEPLASASTDDVGRQVRGFDDLLDR